MTELDIYKFVTENNVEWHKHENQGKKDVILFPSIHDMIEFNKLLSGGILDEEGVECRMKDGYLCFWMNDICEYYGVEMEKVFIRENWDSD